jgi:hypothetical protein
MYKILNLRFQFRSHIVIRQNVLFGVNYTSEIRLRKLVSFSRLICIWVKTSVLASSGPFINFLLS